MRDNTFLDTIPFIGMGMGTAFLIIGLLTGEFMKGLLLGLSISCFTIALGLLFHWMTGTKFAKRGKHES